MPSQTPVRVAVVGLGFGAEFIPIYQAHPDAEMAAVCRRDRAALDACGDKFGVGKRYENYRDVLADPDIDAVHINSPIPDHGPQTIAALEAGKHVACTVPMATEKDQIKQIVGLQRETGLTYMMMETVVYAREYLFVKAYMTRASWGASSSCAAATSRTWTAGRTTGRGCRRCGTPPTASAPASPFCRARASRPSRRAWSATARGGCATT